MKLNTPISVKEAANFLQIEYVGDGGLIITGINEIHKVEKGDLTFVDVEKYYDKALKSQASIILINKEVTCPEQKALLISESPFLDYNKLVEKFRLPENQPSQSGYTDPQAQIGEGTVIYPGCYIANGVTIGKNCQIHPNVTIHTNTHLGDNVIIQANTVIGADAYYYKKFPSHFEKMISCGRVIIHDNVEVGTLCTIDKGVSGDTIIDEGTKLDSQVHVGHGVVIGKRCLITAQVGIGGKTTIEDEVVLLGQVGVAKDLRIGKGALVLSKTGVSKSLEGGKVYFGIPVQESRTIYRQLAALRKLPDWINQVEKFINNLQINE